MKAWAGKFECISRSLFERGPQQWSAQEDYIHLILIIKVIYLNYSLKRSLKCVMLAILTLLLSNETEQLPEKSFPFGCDWFVSL